MRRETKGEDGRVGGKDREKGMGEERAEIVVELARPSG